MAKKYVEKAVTFPQNDCVVFGQLAPIPERVRVPSAQEAPYTSNARSAIKRGK